MAKIKKGSYVYVPSEGNYGKVQNLLDDNQAEILMPDGSIVIEKIDLLIKIALLVRQLWPLLKQLFTSLKFWS